jgi:hypothetical protein
MSILLHCFINSPRYFRNMEEKLSSKYTLLLNKSTANPDFSLRERVKTLPFSFDNLQHARRQGVKCHATNFLEHLQCCSVCDPTEIFFTSKFSYRPFLQPHPLPIKLKLHSKLVVGNHLDQSIIMVGRSETLVAVRSYLLHSFLQVDNIAVPFTSHCRPCNYGEQKLFS